MLCGDALCMAKDVETALTGIVAAHGGRTPPEAIRFVGELKAPAAIRRMYIQRGRGRASSGMNWARRRT
jgi:sulfite reductase alpha subunit-like flavoprotein